MKKLFFVLLAVLTATIFSSCEEMKSNNYKVTILWETDAPMIIQPNRVFKALTESGDTVLTVVREDVVLNNKLPYKAIMAKNLTARFGYVEKSVPEDKK